MSRCQHCGASVLPNEKFCAKCGAPVQDQPPANSLTQYDPYAQNGYQYGNGQYNNGYGYGYNQGYPNGQYGYNGYNQYGYNQYGYNQYNNGYGQYGYNQGYPNGQYGYNGYNQYGNGYGYNQGYPNRQYGYNPGYPSGQYGGYDQYNRGYDYNRSGDYGFDSPEPEEKTESKANGPAIAGFVFSLLSLFSGFPLFVLLGFILSLVGLKIAKRTGRSRGLAVAGTVITTILLILEVVAVIAVVVLVFTMGGTVIAWLESAGLGDIAVYLQSFIENISHNIVF